MLNKYYLDEWMKKLAFGRVNQSRPTFQWKHCVPISPWKQLTGTQEYPHMWSCNLQFVPVSTKHIILSRACFTHLGYLPVPWIWNFSVKRKKWDMTEALLHTAHLICCMDDNSVIQYKSEHRLVHYWTIHCIAMVAGVRHEMCIVFFLLLYTYSLPNF